MAGTVVVVGLGPAGPELLSEAARSALAGVPAAARFLRTSRHPAASVAVAASAFDHRYEAAATMDEVYGGIVEDLAAAGWPTACPARRWWPSAPSSCCGPGRDRGGGPRGRPRPQLPRPGLGAARHRPPGRRGAAGRRHRSAVEATGDRGPLLVDQADSAFALSEVKLAVEDGPVVTVLQRLGLPDERVGEAAWHDLDREVEADHLTTLWVPQLAAPVAGELERLRATVRALRERCPWDREQTHRASPATPWRRPTRWSRPSTPSGAIPDPVEAPLRRGWDRGVGRPAPVGAAEGPP